MLGWRGLLPETTMTALHLLLAALHVWLLGEIHDAPQGYETEEGFFYR